jgi:hypothetical protein
MLQSGFTEGIRGMPAEDTFKLSVPVVPPPDSPLPLAVVTPLIVPAPGKV